MDKKIELQIIYSLINYEAVDYLDLLKPEYFNHYRELFLIINDLVLKGRKPDEAEIFQINKNLVNVLTEVSESFISTADVNKKIYSLIDLYKLNEVKRISKQLLNANQIDETEESIGKLIDITSEGQRKDFRHIKDSVKDVLRSLDEIKSGKDEFMLKTDFIDVDSLIGGLPKGELIILAARPAMGKTALALNLMLNVNKSAIFSLEMSEHQLVCRLLSILTGVNSFEIMKANVDPKQLIYKAQELSEKAFYIDDTAGLSVPALMSKAKRLKRKHDIKFIIVDYLQLMKASAGNREQEISTISRALKQIAKDNDIPVLALSQLNRAVETRPDKKPRLSDLRESGAIEQDADKVLMLYRPAYYGFESYKDGEITDTKNYAELLIEKNRTGAIGKVDLHFQPELTKFANYSSFI
jgi:replicative DNA helicase